MFEQAEALVHFSNDASNEKFHLVDLQGADYKLYDPEIKTIETLIVSVIFCAGNLRGIEIYNCFTGIRRKWRG